MLKREIKRRVFLYRIYLLFGRIFFSERLATISLCDEIRHKSQYKVYDLMLRLFYLQDRCLTTILIDSQGGYVDGADYIIDSIHNTTHYVNVVNVGMCCSAAVDIYLSCCNRYATKNSYFIIHHTKTSIRWHRLQRCPQYYCGYCAGGGRLCVYSVHRWRRNPDGRWF